MAAKKTAFMGTTDVSEENADLLLGTAKSEYDNENGRIASFDSKMSILLPTSIAYLLAIIAMEKFVDIVMTKVSNVGEAIIPVVALILYAIGLLFAVGAIVIMFYVLLPRKYVAIDTRDFYNSIYLAKENRVVFKLHLYQRYVDAASHNRERNNRRMKDCKVACMFMVISIFAVVVYNLVRILML